jgi:uncharacterized protein
MFKLTMCGSDGSSEILTYDPHASTLVDANSVPVPLESIQSFYNDDKKTAVLIPFTAFSPEMPVGKIRKIKTLKIQLGLKCNFSCEYCNQANSTDPEDGTPTAVTHYLQKLDTWLFEAPERIEFWGGEPLIYWKSLKPLATELRNRFPDAKFLIITNGSLFDEEKIEFLDSMGFFVGLSHDGPGQYVRGKDPLLTEALPFIQKLYLKLSALGRMSFNCVLTKDNMCISDIRQHIANAIGVEEMMLQVQTEELFTPYDEQTAYLGPKDASDRSTILHKVFWENANKGALPTTNAKFGQFFRTIASGIPSSVLRQKCGADSPNVLSMDLYGNVLTCQNTSAKDSRHLLGTVDDFDNLKLTSSTHWSLRKECPSCPVLQLCKGSCMYTQDELWTMGCNNSFAYNLGIFATAMYFITGKVLTKIEGSDIRSRGETYVDVIDVDLIKTGDIWDLFAVDRANRASKVLRRVISIKKA